MSDITTYHAIYYSCEWLNCGMVFIADSEFYDHVLVHVQEVIDKSKDNEDDSTTVCQWCNCAVAADDTYIMRHLYYHAFHTKLMAIGANHAKTKNWPRCHVNPSNRLVIPIIPGPFMCGWRFCDFQSNNVDVFYRHVRTHPQEYRDSRYPSGTNPVCQWDDCSHTATRIDKLVNHLASHTRERRVACHSCGAAFVTSLSLHNHLLRQSLKALTQDGDVKDRVDEHACLQCGRVYASEKMLRDHLRLHVNVLKCDQCDMTCASKYALKRHILYKHTTSRPFPCEQCTYSAKSSSDLLQHVQLHHEKSTPPMMKCRHCSYTCKHNSSLIKHHRLAHAATEEGEGVRPVKVRPYACHLCPRQFCLGKFLSNHLRTRHGLRLPPGFSKFTYQLCEDGLHRLQTTRIDSLEVIRQMVGPQEVERMLQDEVVEEEHQRPTRALPVSTVAVEAVAVERMLKNDDGSDNMPVTEDYLTLPCV